MLDYLEYPPVTGKPDDPDREQRILAHMERVHREMAEIRARGGDENKEDFDAGMLE